MLCVRRARAVPCATMSGDDELMPTSCCIVLYQWGSVPLTPEAHVWVAAATSGSGLPGSANGLTNVDETACFFASRMTVAAASLLSSAFSLTRLMSPSASTIRSVGSSSLRRSFTFLSDAFSVLLMNRPRPSGRRLGASWARYVLKMYAAASFGVTPEAFASHVPPRTHLYGRPSNGLVAGDHMNAGGGAMR